MSTDRPRHVITETDQVSRATEARSARRQAIKATSGALTGTYGADHLEQLRQEWPR